ncbi:argininosuccinate lyase [Anabrus simplex]|uniref:argininosuccinate lyase n=1 Tax=Anabrus simplex TaxID=316456 RepID=UPI0035A2FA8C
MTESSSKLWGGRFSEKTDLLLEKINSSLQYDKRMCQEDLQGSEAYARALQRANLLTKEEMEAIHKGLAQISKEWEKNTFKVKPMDEDIHTANERRLKELIGLPATKLHTGRSRNDQSNTDLRLWLRSRIGNLDKYLRQLVKEMVRRSTEEKDILMPGYTHLQRAQPVRWSHWLLSYAWSFKIDVDRLAQLYDRINVMTLGSGAIAGNPFPIDRQLLAKDLNFTDLSPNSMYAVGDRDFVAEFLFWASLTAVHLSRLAEDLILFSSQEFGFVKLADSFTTGSSLMPQKRNPDGLEILRGKAGRIFGHCTGFMMVLKGLPSTYNKDLQEDKEATFDTYDTMEDVLQLTEGLLSSLKVDKVRCTSALSPDMLATDIAYYLVRKGIPFREAHHLAGKVVAEAEKKNMSIMDLPLEELKTISATFEDDSKDIWHYENSVEQYQSTGGTSLSSIEQQTIELNKWLLIRTIN